MNLRKRQWIAPVVFLFLLFLLWPVMATQDLVFDDLGTFHRANEEYRENRFDAALASYLELTERGFEDPVLLYNLGNVYVQLGQPGRAVWMYERALRLEPRNIALRQNLKMVAPAENEKRPFVLFVPFYGLRDFFSLDEWTWIQWWLLLIAAILVSEALVLRPGVLKDNLRVAGRLAMALFLIGFVMFCWKYSAARPGKWGVALESTLTRFGPNEIAKEQLSLPAGRKILVQGVEGDWLEIAVPGEAHQTYLEASRVGRL